MSVAQALFRHARLRPDAIAIAQGGRTISYASLGERVARLAGFLVGRGLVRGDTVGILQPNSPEVLETMLACWSQGLVCVPINARSTPYEVGPVLEDAGPRAVVFGVDYAAHVAGLDPDVVGLSVGGPAPGAAEYEPSLAGASPLAPVPVHPAEPAWLFYSSGTTGRMKGAILSHRSLLFMALSYFGDLDPMPGDAVVLHAAPLTHGSGLYAVMPVLKGATQVLTASRSYDPEEMLALIEEWRATNIAFLAPTMLNRLVAAYRGSGADVSTLRCCVYGGAPMYLEDTKAALAAFGPVLAQIYGQAECPVTIARMSPAEHTEALAAGDSSRLASVGRPYTGVEVRIDGGGAAATPGEPEVGEVLIRGDIVMSGYWRNEAATAEAIVDDWLHTGDLGWFDAAGNLHLVDRSKDVIISGAANIYPREVEEVLLQHPTIREVCVVGAPDEEWGERVVAVMSQGDGADGRPAEQLREELTALCRERLSGYKVPREIAFVDDLPKSAYGKILKRTVRERYWKDHDRLI